MVLAWTEWRNDQRIQRAENSNPSMKPGEAGQPVHLLQAALILNGFDVALHGITRHSDGVFRQNNNYGQQTAAAVRACEQRFGLTIDGGVAGREVISRLDRETNTFYLTNAGQFGATLARSDAPLAVGKIASALFALNLLRAGGLPATVAPLVDNALQTHFRLLPPGAAGDGIRRARTLADLNAIIATFTALGGVLNGGATTFEDGIPVNGVKTAAESNTGSRLIRFGPFFRNFDGPLGNLIGPHSRAAILLHEGTHAVDPTGASGRQEIHISEFEPAYNTQTADRSILNPSSYAGFAAHIANGSDPNPRFGLGAGRNR
jgi:peptidoglycan hydrolase-like protein with peptidoglycan-binding domain